MWLTTSFRLNTTDLVSEAMISRLERAPHDAATTDLASVVAYGRFILNTINFDIEACPLNA